MPAFLAGLFFRSLLLSHAVSLNYVVIALDK